MYQIQSKNDSIPLTSFATLAEVKWWFETICNIPSNWIVICPDETILQGKDYQSFVSESAYNLGYIAGYSDRYPDCSYPEDSDEYDEWWEGYNDGSYNS